MPDELSKVSEIGGTFPTKELLGRGIMRPKRLFTAFFAFATFCIPLLSAERTLTCASFEDAQKSGIDAEQLRSEYKQAYIVGGGDGCIFPTRGDEVGKAWTEFQLLLSERVRAKQGVEFERRKLFNIAFFSPDGRIEYYLFGHIDEAHNKALCEVVREVAAEYRFPVTGDRQFSQCGSLFFKPRKVRD